MKYISAILIFCLVFACEICNSNGLKCFHCDGECSAPVPFQCGSNETFCYNVNKENNERLGCTSNCEKHAGAYCCDTDFCNFRFNKLRVASSTNRASSPSTSNLPSKLTSKSTSRPIIQSLSSSSSTRQSSSTPTTSKVTSKVTSTTTRQTPTSSSSTRQSSSSTSTTTSKVTSKATSTTTRQTPTSSSSTRQSSSSTSSTTSKVTPKATSTTSRQTPTSSSTKSSSKITSKITSKSTYSSTSRLFQCYNCQNCKSKADQRLVTCPSNYNSCFSTKESDGRISKGCAPSCQSSSKTKCCYNSRCNSAVGMNVKYGTIVGFVVGILLLRYLF